MLTRLFRRRRVERKTYSQCRREIEERGSQDVIVFLLPLASLLASAEQQKGASLTRSEVCGIRDGAACVTMPVDKAEAFLTHIHSAMPITYIDAEKCWERWQEVRHQGESSVLGDRA